MKIPAFDVEQWSDKYETTPGVKNIAETCVASVSVDELIALNEDSNQPSPLQSSLTLTYGPIRGSEGLRGRLASLYSAKSSSPFDPENILIFPGAISANFMLLYTLISPGDHVVCVYPAYQQLYGVPETLGAEVSLWKQKPEEGFVPNFESLKSLVKANTKMLIINNPNNPTGAITPKSLLKQLVDFCKEREIIIFADEVYRPLFHGVDPTDAEYPPSILSFGYSKAIATGSMSKAYSLAGIRIGWVASLNRDFIEAVASARDYSTISVSQVDDKIATYALSPGVIHGLLARNIKLAQTNVALLDAFVKQHQEYCYWVKPAAGTTAFIQFKKAGKPVNDVEFCLDVLDKTKVFFLPGQKCFGPEFPGFVRIGYCNHTTVLVDALEHLSAYVREYLA